MGRDIAQYWDLQNLVAAVEGRQFDTVVCMDVINHVADDRVTMAQMAKVTKPGGRLIVVAPAYPSLHGKRDEALGHLRRYSRTQLRTLVEEHGFTIRRMRYWNFISLAPYWLMERVFKRPVPEQIRWGNWNGRRPSPLYRFLGWWYRAVENRLLWPIGLTWLVVADRNTEESA